MLRLFIEPAESFRVGRERRINSVRGSGGFLQKITLQIPCSNKHRGNKEREEGTTKRARLFGSSREVINNRTYSTWDVTHLATRIVEYLFYAMKRVI